MKLTYVNEYEINSTGFNKLKIREMKLWDIRKVKDDQSIESPVQNLNIENRNEIPYFDYDINILYAFGIGEENMHFYDLNNGMVNPCNYYLFSHPIDSIIKFDKKTMDYNKCELANFGKYSRKNIFYFSFNYTKKNPEFN